MRKRRVLIKGRLVVSFGSWLLEVSPGESCSPGIDFDDIGMPEQDSDEVHLESTDDVGMLVLSLAEMLLGNCAGSMVRGVLPAWISTSATLSLLYFFFSREVYL